MKRLYMRYAYREMSTDNRERVMSGLLKNEKGVLFFEGPSGSGKSLLLADVLKANGISKRFSNEEFTELLIGKMRCSQSYNMAIKKMIKQLKCFNIIGIEDVDFLAGKPVTLKCIAEIVNTLSEDKLIIFTGINMKTRVPELIDRVKVSKFIYFDRKKR